MTTPTQLELLQEATRRGFLLGYVVRGFDQAYGGQWGDDEYRANLTAYLTDGAWSFTLLPGEAAGIADWHAANRDR